MKFFQNKKIILIALFAIFVFYVGRVAVAEDVAPGTPPAEFGAPGPGGESGAGATKTSSPTAYAVREVP